VGGGEVEIYTVRLILIINYLLKKIILLTMKINHLIMKINNLIKILIYNNQKLLS